MVGPRLLAAKIETFEEVFLLSEAFPDNEFLLSECRTVFEKHLPDSPDDHLYKLSKSGYVESFKTVKLEGSGRPRSVYRLTGKGYKMATQYEKFIERGIRFMNGEL